MNSKSTIQIIHGLDNGEYSDPFQVRSVISKNGMRPDSFAERFWRVLHSVSLCPLAEKYISGGAQEFSSSLPEALRDAWSKFPAADSGVISAVDFLWSTCVNKPICRPCRCKDRIITFLAECTEGDPVKARNAAKRNVSNWLTDKQPTDRETYIKLCYALGLRTVGTDSPEAKYKNANRFLSLDCAQNPLHLSDAEEAIHYFCLKYPLGHELSADEDYDGAANYRYALSLIEKIGTVEIKSDDSWMFTAEARNQTDLARTEEDILSYAQSCRTHDSDEYYTAKCVLKDFISAYEDDLSISVHSEKRHSKIRKDDARRIISAFENLDCDISALDDLRSDNLSLADILYASGIANECISGLRPVNRTIVLLCLLAQNCGAIFNPDQVDIIPTDDFTDIRSFNEFFRLLNATLEDCSMAAINPRRRFDFIILYSYFLFSRDAMMGELSDAFSLYLSRAIERLTT